MELPRLEPLWQKYGSDGLNVLAVEAFQDREGALEFRDEHGLTYDLVEDVEDSDGRVSAIDQLEIQGYPSSFLVDREGRIFYYHFGYDDGDDVELERQIVRLLAR